MCILSRCIPKEENPRNSDYSNKGTCSDIQIKITVHPLQLNRTHRSRHLQCLRKNNEHPEINVQNRDRLNLEGRYQP